MAKSLTELDLANMRAAAEGRITGLGEFAHPKNTLLLLDWIARLRDERKT